MRATWPLDFLLAGIREHGRGMSAHIDAEELERRLAEVRAGAAGETPGVFGPRSMIWRVDREAALFLGAGRALLLQLAHPWVAAGIAQHSTTLPDPIGRFHRTFEIMFTLVFGSLDQACAAARRLHKRHRAVRGVLPAAAGPFAEGSAYTANEADALMWVHATLIDTALRAHDLVLPPLTAEERERYYQESRRLGGLFGLSLEMQPPTWAAFQAYCEGMWHSNVLAVSPEARRIGEQVLSGAGTWLRSPGWYRALTAHLLPQPLRERFALPYGTGERRSAERAQRLLRRVYPALPLVIRHVGPYHEAMGRLAGRPEPSRVVQGLNRLWIGRPIMARRESS
jgi:uncharacterized protein (DUF2236 family)